MMSILSRAHMFRAGVLAAALCALHGAGSCIAAPPSAAKPGSAAVSPVSKAPEAGTQTVTIPDAGESNEVRLYVPQSAAGKTMVPMVMVLHGGAGWATQIEHMADMNPVADANGFLVAYPNGTKSWIGYTWNAGDCCGMAMKKNTDHIAFFRTFIDTMVREHGVDPARVYATGISNGGIMSHRLACDLSDKIAAVAPIAGALMVECRPRRPVSVMIFHGTADKGLPAAGGSNPGHGARNDVFPSLAQSIQAWVKTDRCPAEGKETYRKGEVKCTTYGPCDQGTEVTYCKIEGGGHTWPGGEPDFEKKLGHMTRDISASAAMWEFFSRHPLTP